MYKLLIGLILFALQACSFIINDWSDGNYVVSAWHGSGNTKDLLFDLSDSFHGRVTDVHKIGSNETYIIVLDNLENYWILNKEKDFGYLNADEIMQGPYLRKEFRIQKQKLEIAELDFTEEF